MSIKMAAAADEALREDFERVPAKVAAVLDHVFGLEALRDSGEPAADPEPAAPERSMNAHRKMAGAQRQSATFAAIAVAGAGFLSYLVSATVAEAILSQDQTGDPAQLSQTDRPVGANLGAIDCNAAEGGFDRLVCSDRELKLADDALTKAHQFANVSGLSDAELALPRWIERRERAAETSEAALLKAYERRTAEVYQLATHRYFDTLATRRERRLVAD